MLETAAKIIFINNLDLEMYLNFLHTSIPIFYTPL